jgi:hypothetical protein
MKKIYLIFAAILMSGCAQYGAVTGAIRTNGAEVADKEMEAAVYVLCKGVTVGAWVRRFGTNQASADAWKVLCVEQAVTTPLGITK